MALRRRKSAKWTLIELQPKMLFSILNSRPTLFMAYFRLFVIQKVANRSSYTESLFDKVKKREFLNAFLIASGGRGSIAAKRGVHVA